VLAHLGIVGAMFIRVARHVARLLGGGAAEWAAVPSVSERTYGVRVDRSDRVVSALGRTQV